MNTWRFNEEIGWGLDILSWSQFDGLNRIFFAGATVQQAAILVKGGNRFMLLGERDQLGGLEEVLDAAICCSERVNQVIFEP